MGISEYWRHKLAEIDAKEFERQCMAEGGALEIWPVWHRTCADVAFFMRKDPRFNAIRSQDVLLFNARRPPAHSPMVCESCGKTIKKLDLLAERPPKLIIPVGALH